MNFLVWFDFMWSIWEWFKIGKSQRIHRYPLNDYFEIETDIELVTKGYPKIFLIPHIFDKYILNVDIDKK